MCVLTLSSRPLAHLHGLVVLQSRLNETTQGSALSAEDVSGCPSVLCYATLCEREEPSGNKVGRRVVRNIHFLYFSAY